MDKKRKGEREKMWSSDVGAQRKEGGRKRGNEGERKGSAKLERGREARDRHGNINEDSGWFYFSFYLLSFYSLTEWHSGDEAALQQHTLQFIHPLALPSLIFLALLYICVCICFAVPAQLNRSPKQTNNDGRW